MIKSILTLVVLFAISFLVIRFEAKLPVFHALRVAAMVAVLKASAVIGLDQIF